MTDRGPAAAQDGKRGDPLGMTPDEKLVAEWEARHDVAARGRRVSSSTVQQYLSQARAEEGSRHPAASSAAASQPSADAQAAETASARTESDASGSGPIVVGVDGSPSSRRALRWAVDRAGRTGQPVHAVIAWDYPVMAGIPMNYGMAQASAADWPGTSREILEQTITETLTGDEAARVEQRVVHGHPAQVLREAAADADLLVVGCRGHGGFAGMLLGSVSQHLITHAPCPVTVVRDSGQPGESAGMSDAGATDETSAPRAT